MTLARDSSNLSTPANMVDIVQSVERQIVDLVVAGSSPVIHPIKRVSPNKVIFFIASLIYYRLELKFAPVGRTALKYSRNYANMFIFT